MRESFVERFRGDYTEMRGMGGEGPIGAVWWVLRGWISCAWDGSDLASRFWQLRHSPVEMIWHPPIEINWRLGRWNPVFWLVLLFGEV